jgi:truncated hemoglobin YjbI
MKDFNYPNHPTREGYMTMSAQRAYIQAAIHKGLLPENAHRLPDVVSLKASANRAAPIQFWQLYSVLGQDPIVHVVENFYQRVFADEPWFTSVFERVGGVGHHINTQASMWIDVMGGGPYYHGADFRLQFHHTHNAVQLMTEKGAERWSQLMLDALEDSGAVLTDDPRVRIGVNTFLAHFMSKYAQDFGFENRSVFGETNAPFKPRINLLKMDQKAIEALSEEMLRDALVQGGVDVSPYGDKAALVQKALMV